METQLNKKSIINKKTLPYIIFFILFVSVWAVIFIKCKYGYAHRDETYYLQVTHRIVQGDALLSEEWHTSQLFSYLLFPFVQLYISLFKTTEGIVLFFRYFYTLIWGLASLFIFYKLNKLSFYGAAFSSIVMLIYAPFSIMAFSYNTLGIMFLLLSCVINMMDHKPIYALISGSFYSFSVICCPALCVLLIYYLIYFLVIKKDKKYLLYFILGIAIQAIIFIIFVLSRTSVTKIMESIPCILNDPTHKDHNIIYKMKVWIKALLLDGNLYIFLIIVACTFASFFIKNKNIMLTILAVMIGLLLIYVYKTNYYINHLMFPFALLGPFLYQIKNNKIRDLLYSVWIPGAIYSICLHYMSNQDSYAIFSALSISSIASICSIFIYIEQQTNIKNIQFKITKIIIVLVVVLQICLELDVRWHTVFWDKDIGQQIILLKEGPEKGIYVSEEKSSIYSTVLKAKEVFDFKGNSILFLTSNPLYYLDNMELRSSACSSWLSSSKYVQLKYYEFYPNRLPDNIFYSFMENGEYDELLQQLIDKYHYKLVLSNEYGKLYTK